MSLCTRARDGLDQIVFAFGACRNVKVLLRVGLHWHVPFIEVLSETTSGLVSGSPDSEEHT